MIFSLKLSHVRVSAFCTKHREADFYLDAKEYWYMFVSQIISSVINKGFQVELVNYYLPVAQISISTNLVL
jgi:hypothetical protein